MDFHFQHVLAAVRSLSRTEADGWRGRRSRRARRMRVRNWELVGVEVSAIGRNWFRGLSV